MSVRFSMSDGAFGKARITIDQGDLTLTLNLNNDNFVVEVGENLWVNTEFRQRITRTLEQMRDALREGQWPDGPLAVSYATMVGVDTPKGQIIVANAAVAPALLDESGLRIAYNIPIVGGTSPTGAGGAGSSVNRGAILDRIIEFIRETLATTATIPGG